MANTPDNKNKDQQKQAQQKQANDAAAKSYCKRCHKEIFPAFRCGCGGGGGGPGGGGDGGDSAKDEKYDASGNLLHDKASMHGDASKSSHADSGLSYEYKKPSLTPRETMLKTIADLQNKKLLTIEDNKGLSTLTIKCDPKQLSEAQRKAVNDFVKEIKNELKDFKEKNGLKDKDCIVKTEADKQGNILSCSINIPNPKLYNKFIEQLKAKNLLPSALLEAQATKSASQDNKGDKKFNPSPLSTKLMPPGHKD